MPDLKEVGSKIMEIEGVTGYVIATSDAAVALSQNLDDPETLASLLALCVMNAEGIKQTMGMTRLKHFALTSETADDYVILPLSKHVVGIRKANTKPTEEIIKGFRKIFRS